MTEYYDYSAEIRLDVPDSMSIGEWVETHPMGVPYITGRLAVALDEGATMPKRAHKWDAGLDFAANEDAVIPPHGWESVGTGVHVGIPQGTVGLLFPRSSMGFKRGLGFINSVGVIDSGYTGEVRACVHNHRGEPQRIKRGERIAQLVIVPVSLLEPVLVETLGETERGDGGFGSTGR